MRRLGIAAAAVVLVSCGTAPRLSPVSLDGYRVVYRVVDAARGAERATTTEVVEVRRPYGGRVETVRDGKITGGRITSRDHLWQVGEDGELQFGVIRPPGQPTRDASLQALKDAARAGRAVAGGSDDVLGRRCDWFAYRDPAPKPVLEPTPSSRVESCVDATGVVLREVWTLDDKPARVLEAISFDRRPPKKKRFMDGRDPANTKVAQPKGAELVETQTIVRDVIQGRIETPFKLSAPKGWKRDRVALVGSTAGQGARPTQFLSQTYLRDDGLVVVETGSGPQFAPSWSPSEGARIVIGAGEGRVVYRIDSVEIRVLSAIGYARVIAPSQAVAFEFIRGLSD